MCVRGVHPLFSRLKKESVCVKRVHSLFSPKRRRESETGRHGGEQHCTLELNTCQDSACNFIKGQEEQAAQAAKCTPACFIMNHHEIKSRHTPLGLLTQALCCTLTARLPRVESFCYHGMQESRHAPLGPPIPALFRCTLTAGLPCRLSRKEPDACTS